MVARDLSNHVLAVHCALLAAQQLEVGLCSVQIARQLAGLRTRARTLGHTGPRVRRRALTSRSVICCRCNTSSVAVASRIFSFKAALCVTRGAGSSRESPTGPRARPAPPRPASATAFVSAPDLVNRNPNLRNEHFRHVDARGEADALAVQTVLREPLAPSGRHGAPAHCSPASGGMFGPRR
jgi:hypothetical protein